MMTLLVAGCSQNDVTLTVPESDRAISFKVYTGVQTKGTIMDNTELKKLSEGFGIFAYLSKGGNYGANTVVSSLYMNNVHATYAGTEWAYSPTKYWPTNTTDKVSFFAYAPYNAEGVTFTAANVPATYTGNGTATGPALAFEIPASQKDMTDLVVSKASDNADKAGTDNSGKVTFALGHVLSKVSMYAKTGADLTGNGQTKVFIREVSLVHTKKLNKKATFDMYKGTWTLPTTDADYLANPYPLASASASSDKGVLNLVAAKFADYNQPSIDITTNADGVSLFPQNEYLFFIPMTAPLGTGSAAGDVKAKIVYDIVTKASDAATTAVVSTKTAEVDLKANGFKQGSAYKYTFTVGLTAITVDASVTAWTGDSEVTPDNI